MIYCSSYLDGKFLPIEQNKLFSVINPANEKVSGYISMLDQGQVDEVIQSAQRGFQSYSSTTLEQRRLLLEKLILIYERRYEEMAQAISLEMGAPIKLARESQAECGLGHMKAALKALDRIDFERPIGNRAQLISAPVGVCLLITPWNWPINQIFSKLAPALLSGCSLILKPSEYAPYSSYLVAQMIEEAGYPPGVFNLIYGDGAVIGRRLSEAEGIDLISFTGSNATGAVIGEAAARSFKRVVQELGGKSANIVFADAPLEAAVSKGVLHCFNNTGQSCNAPTRMLVEASVYDQAIEIAKKTASLVKVGASSEEGPHIGPLAMKRQFEQVQKYLEIGLNEGAELTFGYLGRHRDFKEGYFVSPAIFTKVSPGMRVAREEIFGPVLCMIPFETEEQAIQIANDSDYGLAAYIQTADHNKAIRVARRIRAGSVHINGAYQEYDSPFGGFKKSGLGREWGEFGFHHFTEYQCINGYYAI
jgi:aldehyde dehydrogenase (NAD+)